MSRTQIGDFPSHTRRATATVGMWLFLAALFMLFASGMLGYVIVRLNGNRGLGAGHIHLPWPLWLSTGLLLVVSYAVHRALASVRRERQAAFRAWLRVMFAGAAAFVLAQTPAMVVLLREHERARAAGFNAYGLVFSLILLHALHVVGGLVGLVRVTIQGHCGVYDHEHSLPVKHAAMYWHFLDAVWLVMLGAFLVVG